MITLSRSILLSLLLTGVSQCIFAQESVNNASLTGRVTDATGAVVANAAVTVREIATNLTNDTVTSSTGRFRFPYLPIGKYEITVHRAGFSDALRSVTLTIGAAFDLPITLDVGSERSTINVSADAPLLEADRSQVAGTISQNEIANLPYEGRNYLDLALLLPGVSPTNTASTQLLPKHPRSLARATPSTASATSRTASSSTASPPTTTPPA